MNQKLFKLAIGLSLIFFILHRLTAVVADRDLWGYLAFGRLFWNTKTFPYHDVFSFVPTLHPWIYHEWLTGVLFYPLYYNLGASGLQLLKYTFGLSTLGCVYLAARERGANPPSAAFGVFLISGLIRIGYSPVRAQVFTYFFFALCLYLLEKARHKSQWNCLWVLIPIQFIWCNLHAGFLSGLGLIGLYALGESLSRKPCRRYWLILSISVLVTFINPYGIQYWIYITRAISMSRNVITEWLSVYQSFTGGSLDYGAFIQFFFLNIFVILWLIRWREITAGLAMIVSIYLGWRHVRHQVFFAILAGAYLPALFSTYLDDLKSRPKLMAVLYRLGWKIPIISAIMIAFLYAFLILKQKPLSLKIPPLPGVETETDTYYPVGVIEYISKHNLSGNILIYFDWGEYAIWRLYPQCRVALDGRFETVYHEAVAREYFAFLFGEANWRQFIIQYSPDMILLTVPSTIYELIRTEPHWKQIYTDQGSALFLKNEGALTILNNVRQ